MDIGNTRNVKFCYSRKPGGAHVSTSLTELNPLKNAGYSCFHSIIEPVPYSDSRRRHIYCSVPLLLCIISCSVTLPSCIYYNCSVLFAVKCL